MRRFIVPFVGLLAATPAFADWTGKDYDGFKVTFRNANTCSSVACVPIAQPVDSNGSSFGVAGNPFFVSPAAGTTFSVNAASLPLPAGAATQTTSAAILAAIGTNDPSKAGGTPASARISTAAASTLQIVALSGSTKIYVTSVDFMAAGTTNFTLVYGTGSNCGTGTTALTGAYPLIPQTGISKGSGVGAILVVPAGNALCGTNSQAIQVSGSVSYQQF